MTQHVDQPLLTEQDGASTPVKRRRAVAAKPRSSTPGVSAAAKPKTRRTVKKAAPASEELPGLAEPESPAPVASPSAAESTGTEDRPVKRRRTVTRAVAPKPEPAPAPVIEEWSPSRREPEAKTEPAPASGTAVAAPAPLSTPAAAPMETPVAPSETPAAAPARKYPVYIPRHIARQMEEQGQTAPLAVPADAIPEAARAAVEAAQAAHQRSAPPPRSEPSSNYQPTAADSREHGRDRDRGRGRHREREPRDREQDLEREYAVSDGPAEAGELGVGEGIVEISGKGFGFLRDAKRNFAQHPQDIFVTPEMVRKYNLRDGQWVKGETRRGGRGAQLCQLQEVNGAPAEQARILPAFEELTVISPMERITLETTPERSTTRIIDLFAPIGKGQRGIIVAPPRTGKTTLLQHIADAVVKKHPDIILIILLVDERPEEVTDIKRTVPGAEVMASSNDMDVKSHTRIAQLAIERAKRLVESGKDVFVLLDSITRVGRAFNNAMANGGRTMSGGVDSRALEIPRRIFAAARNTEEAGSLTIVATALIETGSKADELIFQEFKGTGNMELVLDRKISDQRIYPAVDIFQSGTRREELLIPADDLHKIAIIRRGLAGHKPMEAIERLLFFLRKFPTNAQMLREIPG